MDNYQGKRVARKRWASALLIAAAAVVIIAALAALAYQRYGKQPSRPPDLSREEPAGSGEVSASGSGSAGSAQSPDVSSAPTEDDPPEDPPEDDPPDDPPQADPPEDTPYDFSQPAPRSEAVDNSYFDDAAFVGDSRTDGFMLYSGIGTGTNLTSNGLSIFKLAEKKTLKIDGQKYTLLEALALEEYGKVYLSPGSF